MKLLITQSQLLVVFIKHKNCVVLPQLIFNIIIQHCWQIMPIYDLNNRDIHHLYIQSTLVIADTFRTWFFVQNSESP